MPHHSDVVHLARAAMIVRRDMFNIKIESSGSFQAQCQEQSVPTSLLALVTMPLNRPTIKSQANASSVPQPALTISQLLLYNS